MVSIIKTNERKIALINFKAMTAYPTNSYGVKEGFTKLKILGFETGMLRPSDIASDR
jgi:hypothetical protein